MDISSFLKVGLGIGGGYLAYRLASSFFGDNKKENENGGGYGNGNEPPNSYQQQPYYQQNGGYGGNYYYGNHPNYQGNNYGYGGNQQPYQQQSYQQQSPAEEIKVEYGTLDPNDPNNRPGNLGQGECARLRPDGLPVGYSKTGFGWGNSELIRKQQRLQEEQQRQQQQCQNPGKLMFQQDQCQNPGKLQFNFGNYNNNNNGEYYQGQQNQQAQAQVQPPQQGQYQQQPYVQQPQQQPQPQQKEPGTFDKVMNTVETVGITAVKVFAVAKGISQVAGCINSIFGSNNNGNNGNNNGNNNGGFNLGGLFQPNNNNNNINNLMDPSGSLGLMFGNGPAPGMQHCYYNGTWYHPRPDYTSDPRYCKPSERGKPDPFIGPVYHGGLKIEDIKYDGGNGPYGAYIDDGNPNFAWNHTERIGYTRDGSCKRIDPWTIIHCRV